MSFAIRIALALAFFGQAFLAARLAGLIWLLVLTSPASAIVVDWLDTSDGLPDSAVSALARDRDGYLWIATQGGLVRHEGTRLNVLRHDPDLPGSVPGNNVMAMMAASDGSIWASISGHGIVRIDRLTVEQHWQPTTQGGVLEGHFVWAMTEACDGSVWAAFASDGVVRIDPVSGQTRHFTPGTHGLPETGFYLDLATDKSCRNWLVRADGLWQFEENGNEVSFKQWIDADRIDIGAFITLHLEGDLAWVGSTAGLMRVDLGKTAVEDLPTPQRWSLDQPVASIATDGRGQLWLGQRRGLALFDPVSGHARVEGTERQSEKLDAVQVADLLLGAEGELWIGTRQGGLARLPPGWRGFRMLRPREGAGEGRRVSAVAVAGDGSIWSGAEDSSVRRLDTVSFEWSDVLKSDRQLGLVVLDVLPQEDGIWVLHRRHLLRAGLRDDHRELVLERAVQDDQTLTFLASAGDGRVWVGAHGAELMMLDDDGSLIDRWSSELEPPRQLPDLSVSAIQRGPDGAWWLLGERKLFRQEGNGEFAVIHDPGKSNLLTMALDGNIVWLASDSILEQFELVDGQLQSLRRFTAGDGLPAGRAQGLVARGDELWLLMSIGLARLDVASGNFRLFSPREGLPVSEFSPGAVVELDDGRFVAGTRDGLLLVDPQAITPALRPPPVRITTIRAGDRLFRMNSHRNEPLRLDWRLNSLEATFAALSYLDPARNRYRVRLLGWDTGWHETIGQERRFYSNLPHGEYLLTVQAANADGIWNLEGDQQRIIIKPPPWRTRSAWIAYALIALAMTGTGWRSLHKRRLRRDEFRQARDRQQLADLQRRVLEQLNESLEPDRLADTIAQAALELSEASECQFGFMDPEFPEHLYCHGTECRHRERAEFERAVADGGPGSVVVLGHEKTLAAIWLPQLRPTESGLEHARMALFAQTAGQVLENARLLLEVRHLARQAQRASAAKSEFLATMSHEIRTPLHGLLGTMELLEQVEVKPAQLEMLRTMRSSGRQLQRILNDVLDLSRIEAGHIELDGRGFDLPRLLESVVELNAANAAASGLELHLRISSRLPVMAIGDSDRIAQILGNLLNNAIKFTDAGRVEVEARLDVAGRLVLAVADTGPGIQPEYRQELFEPFSQAEGATTRRHSGSGLGLAICRRLVAAMGGDIDLASEPGRGSRFTLRLPLEGMSPQSPLRPGLLAGFRLAVALRAPDRRVLLRLARRWSVPVTVVDHLEHAGAAEALVFTPDCIEIAEVRRWAGQGTMVWELGQASAEFATLRRPLTESRLIGALLDLRFSQRSGG